VTYNGFSNLDGEIRMPPKQIWHSPEEIIEIAFPRSSVVMMNEAHNGWKRCIRTRQIGQRILPVAHQAGVRHLAMEALNPVFAEEGNRTRLVPDHKEGYHRNLQTGARNNRHET
jgi:hypothetical protein